MSRPFILPTVVENTHRGENRYDIYSRLLIDRIVFLGTEVNDDIANAIIAQLLFLESQDPERDVHLYINSPGGSVTAGLAIYDTMQFIRPDVATICVGQAASMGAFLLAAGAKGKRRALPHARLMIHQPSAGVGYSQVTDIEIRANEFQRMKKVLNERMAFHTGQPVEKLASDVERDYFLTAQEGKEYGLIDEVIARHDEASDEEK